MRLHRLIAIILLLESRKKLKAKDLAVALETSERTIYRDVETLCEAGIPIASDFGPTGGFMLMEGYTAGLRIMNCDEAVTLYLSGIASNPNVGSIMQSTLNTLLRNLPEQYSIDIRKAMQQFYFDPENWFIRKEPIPFLDVLRQAIWQSLKLRIIYRKSSLKHEETVDRKIRPYGLVVKSNEWYLVAYCETSREMRVYRCDRLLGAEILKEPTLLPEGFSLEQFWHEWVGEFNEIIRNEQQPDYLVSIRVDETFDEKNYEVINIKKYIGYKILTINLHTFEEASNKALQFSAEAEILSPSELKDYVINFVKRILIRQRDTT